LCRLSRKSCRQSCLRRESGRPAPTSIVTRPSIRELSLKFLGSGGGFRHYILAKKQNEGYVFTVPDMSIHVNVSFR